jgi:hypothetical protein
MKKRDLPTCVLGAFTQEQPPDPQQAAMKQKVVGALKNDPKMREQFLNKVAGPIANKMFECGMVP